MRYRTLAQEGLRAPGMAALAASTAAALLLPAGIRNGPGNPRKNFARALTVYGAGRPTSRGSPVFCFLLAGLSHDRMQSRCGKRKQNEALAALTDTCMHRAEPTPLPDGSLTANKRLAGPGDKHSGL